MTDSDEWKAALAACTVMTLSEAVAAGVIGPTRYVARRAQQRDPEFPQPVGMRGTVGLFSVDDLRAYAAKTARPAADNQEEQASEQQPEREEKWKPIPGFSAYEASDYSVWRLKDGRLGQVAGGFRSVDRTSGGRFLKGQPIRARILVNSGGYAAVNLTDDTGTRRTMLVHRLILLTHDKPCPEGMETLHSERGPLWNRFPEDIRWGLPPENDAERTAALAAAGRAANGRPMSAPKPPATCIRCGGPITRPGGRRCHECVVAIGQEAADLMRAGVRLEDANEQLGYGNAVYLHALAVRYGGWGCCPACSRTAIETAPVTVRERLTRVLRPRSGHRV